MYVHKEQLCLMYIVMSERIELSLDTTGNKLLLDGVECLEDETLLDRDK